MIRLNSALPALSSELCLYCARDPMLENFPVLIFYGPSTTGNSTQNTSRIQAHIFSLAGYDSYLRLTIAPTSSLYAAVRHLPSDLQGDETYRGLAISLLCYFASLTNETKTAMRNLTASRRPNGFAPMMFDEMHAGELAATMEEIAEPGPILGYLTSAITEQSVSWVDMDLLLPAGTMRRALDADDPEHTLIFDENGLPLFNYGQYDQLISQLGQSAFLPTSKIRRAPSRPTAHSKSRILSKDAKISLRRDMCELVDTENSYRDKLSELVNKIAVSFREQNGTGNVDDLFPNSLDQILGLSSCFYSEIQSCLDNTEDEAIADIEDLDSSKLRVASNEIPTTRRDPTGATAFAKVLLAWFPKFLGPYQDYLRTSSHFANIISEGLGDVSSQLSKGLHDIGEQRLRSFLIEPVQRLPRYSLLIDNIISLLPSSHPSLSSFLKARGLVAEICALDASASLDESRYSRKLSSIVQNWPASLSLQGRLLAVIDVVELDPPFEPSSKGNPGMILLFPDRLLLLDKLGDAALSARGVMAELDGPTMPTQIDFSLNISESKTLALSECFELADLTAAESRNGRLLHLINLAAGRQTIYNTHQFKVFCLQGPYEGKAARFSEELAKARVEGRYPETFREGGRWAFRTIAEPDKLSLVAALSEEGQPRGISIPKSRGKISLSVGDAMPTNGTSNSTIMAHIAIGDSGKYHLEVTSHDKSPHKFECSSDTVISLLLKQLDDAVRHEHQQFNDYQISYHRTVLKSLPFDEEKGGTKHRGYRPISPIKMLSKVFGGDGTLSRSTSRPIRDALNMKSLPSLPSLPQSSPSKVQTDVDTTLESKGPSSKITLLNTDGGTYRSPLALLEDTFATYVFALRLRSGNVIGKVLRNRATADELSINDLYNKLLEDPNRIQAAADVPVDVLFAAFEKFLRVAWRERMGPLVAPLAIQNLQSSFDAGRPAVFAQNFKNLLEEMSPQSRRCFAAMIKLLADLLDASGNDGDRGVLIASFAEALILVGNAQEYITILDRLVDDYDRLFEDAVEKPGSSGSATGSLTTSRSFNAGSFSSNTSSLRRKFGMGSNLSRENSKSEPESKVASIWRNLSKNAKSPGGGHSQGNSQPGSISKATLVRSRSTDTAPGMLASLRPESRDRPLTSGSRTLDESRSRPGSSHNATGTMSSIEERASSGLPSLNKKKRRSSLSDLTKVQERATLAPITPLQPRRLQANPSPEKAMTLPKTPSPIRPSLSNRLDKPSPPRSGIPRLGSPQRRENSSSVTNSKENSPTPRIAEAKKSKMRTPGEVTITSYSPQKRTTSRSGIPTHSTGGLSERTWPPNNNISPQKNSSVDDSPKKLRIQSPQKLRERLSQEQKAIAGTETSLQNEINKVAQELSIFKLRAPTLSTSTSPSKTTHQQQQEQTLQTLTTSLSRLTQSLQTLTQTHNTTTSSLCTDIDTSLQIAHRKLRKLDELYKEANAENEALYERFNDELGKILGRVKGGEGVEVMRERMEGAVKEVAGLKAERAKLKREVLGLRALVGE